MKLCYFCASLVSLFISASVNAQACSAEWLKASYTITHSNADGDSRSARMTLWRKPQTVAHQYPQTQITEAWQAVSNGSLKPTRYFDAHQRAIEYQPNDVIHGKRETDWSYRNQLISDQLLQRMTKVSTTGSGCDRTEKYHLKQQGQTLILTWLPAYRLPQRFERRDESGNQVVWQQQQSLSEKAAITAFYQQREAYYATDYADIGDDHTDPFLTQMVTQGFIEAGASGFYNSKGEALEGEHGHSH